MRLLAAPLRRTMVTVPEVVGFHLMVVTSPALGAYPPRGLLKALGSDEVPLVCAKARRGAARARRVVVEKRILNECMAIRCIRK